MVTMTISFVIDSQVYAALNEGGHLRRNFLERSSCLSDERKVSKMTSLRISDERVFP